MVCICCFYSIINVWDSGTNEYTETKKLLQLVWSGSRGPKCTFNIHICRQQSKNMQMFLLLLPFSLSPALLVSLRHASNHHFMFVVVYLSWRSVLFSFANQNRPFLSIRNHNKYNIRMHSTRYLMPDISIWISCSVGLWFVCVLFVSCTFQRVHWICIYYNYFRWGDNRRLSHFY